MTFEEWFKKFKSDKNMRSLQAELDAAKFLMEAAYGAGWSEGTLSLDRVYREAHRASKEGKKIQDAVDRLKSNKTE